MADFKEYHTFGGVDITPVFGNVEFGEMQMVAYNVNREKVPVHTMGSPDARAIARGKRYCSGTCIFAVFDRDALLAAMDDQDNTRVYLGRHEYANFQRGGDGKNGVTDVGRTAQRNGGTVAPDRRVNASELTTTEKIRGALRHETKARLADQVLPFDITLVATNEYGHTTKMVIYGVELMNESGGASIDDVALEKKYQFVCKSISSWEPLDKFNSR